MSKLEIHASQVAALNGALKVLERLGWRNPLNGQVDIWRDVEDGPLNVNIDTPWGSSLVIVTVGIQGRYTVPIEATFIGATRYGNRHYSFETDASGITRIV